MSLNNLKIGVKLIGGFLLVAVIASIIGIVAIYNLGSVVGAYNTVAEVKLPSLKSILIISEAQSAIDGSENALLSTSATEEDRKAAYQRFADAKERADDAWKIYEPLEQTKEEAEVWKKFVPAWEKWWKDHEDFVALAREYERSRNSAIYEKLSKQALQTNAVSFKAAEDLMNKIIEINDTGAKEASREADSQAASAKTILVIVLIGGVILAVFLGLFLTFSITRPLAKVVDVVKKGDVTLRINLTRLDEMGVLSKEIDSLFGILENLVLVDGGPVLQAAANKDLSKRMTKEYPGDYGKMKNNINTVIENLDQALTQVSRSVEQVSSASGQISSGSQQLAEGANEQASSLEEVSSSLEEMSSMTKQNAENANQAKNLAGEAKSAATEGNDSMKKMAEAINKIKASSDNTAKIIKTIDEIAFQTNLLALNAAVEAARAGEAGKGFAVVAEEVRNLAMRSAEAAKNTANMIEESVKNSEGGVKITEEVAKILNQIVDRAGKVNDLIAEIAAASNEQTQGIDQVNTAVAQMNKVTQSNAANSEESASAAEELNGQAEELANMVGSFTLTSANTRQQGTQKHAMQMTSHFHAGTKQQTAVRAQGLIHKEEAKPLAGRMIAKAPGASKRPTRVAVASVDGNGGRAVKPEEVIPLNDEELKEF